MSFLTATVDNGDMYPHGSSPPDLTVVPTTSTARANPAPSLAALRRAQRLRRLADRIERALVFPLHRYTSGVWDGDRAALATRMLVRDLTQLRRAMTQLRRQADEVELGAPEPAA